MPQGVQHDERGPNAEGSSPRRLKVATYQLFEATASNLTEMRQRILQETAGHYLGPMPACDFLKEFMPWNEDAPQEYKEVRVTHDRLNSIITLPQCSEAEVYPQFIRALEGWSGLRAWSRMTTSSAPPLQFEDSHKHRDRDCLCLSADISVYSGPQFVKRAQPQKMDFANLHSWVDIKLKQEFDAFSDETPTGEAQLPHVDSSGDGDVQGEDSEADNEDPEHSREFEDETPEALSTALQGDPTFPFENVTVKSCNTRAQLSSYAGAVMATQYRNHLFTVSIAGNRARFIRWERASAIVTEAFDFTEQPLLFEFFKRFRQLNLTQRGSNPHAKPATKKEADLARTLLQDVAPELWLGLAGRVHLKHNSVDINTQPFLKLEFKGQSFIVPAPHCHERDLSPFGSASHGVAAIALDKEGPTTGSVCFVKDGWHDLHRPSEYDIYGKLHASGVRNIAEILCGGDWIVGPLEGDGNGVPDAQDYSVTVGHIYALKPWVRSLEDCKIKPRRLRNNLIALNVIGWPLKGFRKAHELVGALADAMEAYEDALQKAKVMHRDISESNILLVRSASGEVRGILIDWDHSTIWDPCGGKNNSRRTGTWRFMSVSLLRSVDARHTPTDDRESCLYVLLWSVLCHLHHTLSPYDLRRLLAAFDKYTIAMGELTGGDYKEVSLLRHIKRKCLCIEFHNVKLAPLTRLIRELASAFVERYGPEDVDEEDNPQLKATVGNGDWLLSKLSEAHRELKDNADTEDDWVSRAPDHDKAERVLPAYLSHLVRSRPHWPLDVPGTSKRTLAGASGEELGSETIDGDSERQAKRPRA